MQKAPGSGRVLGALVRRDRIRRDRNLRLQNGKILLESCPSAMYGRPEPQSPSVEKPAALPDGLGLADTRGDPAAKREQVPRSSQFPCLRFEDQAGS
jgi:hypothetical protein